MQYLLLIYADETSAPRAEDEVAEMMAAYGDYTQRITAQGINRGGQALQGVANATTVRVRDGERIVTDGPFAETKEQLGGFYLVECDDLDEALEAAAGIPDAARGSIEVRPLWEIPEEAG